MSNSDTKLTEVAQVDVQSAWLSKINWGEVVKVLAAFAAVKGVNIPPEVQNDVLLTIISVGGLYTWVVKTWFTKTITAASAASPQVPTSMVVKVLIAAFVLSLFLPAATRAADVAPAAKALPLTGGYPLLKCGAYYGVNTMGSTGAVSNAQVGTQVAQAAIGLTIGYSCPLTADGQSFWFADGMFDFSNLNGSTNGLALTGPAKFEQRFGFGTPIGSMLSAIPVLGGLSTSVPSLIPLPAGVTAGASAPYIFGSFHQDDVGVYNGFASNKQFLLSAGFGVGLKTRLSNGVVFDPWAEIILPSSKMCVGILKSGCTNIGTQVQVGFALEY